MNTEQIKYSLGNVFNRKTRSFLTVLSIMIGITAIFALISFGEGIKNYMDVLAEEAGADKLFIQAKGTGAPGIDDNFYITQDDVDFVSKINGVNEIAGLYMGVGQITYKKDIKYVFLSGYDTDKYDFIFEGFNAELYSGRVLKEDDTNKALLGYNYMLEKKVFDKPLELGDKFEINNVPFEVVGFITEVGNPTDDSNLYITKEAFELLNPDSTDKYGFVLVSTAQGEDPEELADKIADKLRKRKDQKEGEEDFSVESFSDLLETFATFIDIINGILLLIALISVIVASVNIMNTMYTAVLERTKEIGVMKAIGAKNNDIVFIFVFESAFLGFIGGAVGIMLGYFIATAGGKIAAALGYSALYPVFPISLILGCLIFATLIGAVSGILPARQASKLKPVDALRYE